MTTTAIAIAGAATPLRLGAGLYVALALPPVSAALEASMAGHMLVQLPLLALAGGLMAKGLVAPRAATLAGFNRGGIAAILLAAFAWAWWMVPRQLDAALAEPAFELAKFASVPLLVGAPLALGWPQAGPLTRGFFWAHAIAMLLALGWLYLQSPERLCVGYRLDQQALLGGAMLGIAAAIAAALTVRAFVGPTRTTRRLAEATQPSSAGCRALLRQPSGTR